MAHTTPILIIEDEEDLAAALAFNLERAGYAPRVALNGAEGLRRALSDPTPGLILLDLMLPDLPGAEICRRLRADPRTAEVPIIMVTARASELDRVAGFEVGADDYVVKPFSTRELLLRVRALLRRSRPAEVPDEARFDFGVLRVDPAGHRLWVADVEVRLTALEFRLLLTLHQRRGRVQTRETLLTDVWGYRPDITTRTVDTHVKRLREKLGGAGAYVETVRGVGYRLRAHPDEGAE